MANIRRDESADKPNDQGGEASGSSQAKKLLFRGHTFLGWGLCGEVWIPKRATGRPANRALKKERDNPHMSPYMCLENEADMYKLIQKAIEDRPGASHDVNIPKVGGLIGPSWYMWPEVLPWMGSRPSNGLLMERIHPIPWDIRGEIINVLDGSMPLLDMIRPDPQPIPRLIRPYLGAFSLGQGYLHQSDFTYGVDLM